MEFAPSTIIIYFVETARFTKTLAANSPIDFICQMTGLSEEEIIKL